MRENSVMQVLRAVGVWVGGLACWAGLGGDPAWAQGSGPAVAEVLALKGEAWSDGQAIKPGDRLQAGAALRTGAPGRLRLRFEDGSVLVLGDRSELRLERYEQPAGGTRQASLWLQLGLIGQSVRPQPGGSWKVRTPSAVTAVRGTEFMVEVDEGHKTAVHVQSGEVAVEPQGGLRLRGAGPPSRRLHQPRQGTDCDAERGCSEVKAWPEQRVQALRDRLDF